MPAELEREPLFRVRGVAKTYRTGEVEVRALREVDLDIGRGEFVVLLGPSGSGKSTLLNILGGLDVPSAGQVLFGEHDLSRASEAELTAYRRRHVGFVFQFYNLIPSLTVRENVALVTDIVEHPMLLRHPQCGVGHPGDDARIRPRRALLRDFGSTARRRPPLPAMRVFQRTGACDRAKRRRDIVVRTIGWCCTTAPAGR